MKRFWRSATTMLLDEGWTVELDGRPLRTPARALLAVPTERLAAAISDEWNSVQGAVDPRSMPLTGFANAAIDRVASDPQAFADGLSRYADGDLACYRTDFPRELAARQGRSWDALLAWARRRFDVDFATTCGVIHVPQPPATIQRLAHAVESLDSFKLAALSSLVTIGGSLVAALAVLEGAVAAEEAWAAVTIDERWQLEQWGSDAEAEAALESRRRDFFAAARFLELLKA